MKSREYIISVLGKLHDEFPSFTFKYQFDSLDDCHVIEYSPFDLVGGDKDFEDKKYSLLEDYFNREFGESLVFIDEFDPVGISNPEIVHEGFFNYSPKQSTPQVLLSNVQNWMDISFVEDEDFSLAA